MQVYNKGESVGTQENIDYIKKELSNEEKFLESLIKAEKFYKKYRKPLIALGAFVVLAALGYVGYEMKVEHDLKVSNAAYIRLMNQSGTKEDLELLRSKNPKLHELYLYHQALAKQDIEALKRLADSEDPVIKDLATYHLGALKKDEQLLGQYATEGAILRDLAILDDAFLLDKAGNVQQAHQKLELISKESPAAPYALLLRHYGVKR